MKGLFALHGQMQLLSCSKAELSKCTRSLNYGALQAAERRAWEDKEDILEDEEGFVIYDGGTYSRGPIRITPEPGDASEASSSTSHEVCCCKFSMRFRGL